MSCRRLTIFTKASCESDAVLKYNYKFNAVTVMSLPNKGPYTAISTPD